MIIVITKIVYFKMKKEQVKGYVRYQDADYKAYAKGIDENVVNDKLWVECDSEAKEYSSLEEFFEEYKLDPESGMYFFDVIEESVKEEDTRSKIINNVLSVDPCEGTINEGKKEQKNKEYFVYKEHVFPSYVAPDLCKNNTTILQEAQDVVYGDRQEDYGSVTQNFTTIAQLWSAVLGIKVSPEQVGLCMIQVKVAREMNKPKRDNLVDICGYAACLEKMEIENENLPY